MQKYITHTETVNSATASSFNVRSWYVISMLASRWCSSCHAPGWSGTIVAYSGSSSAFLKIAAPLA